MKEREIILDTPYTIGSLELTDIFYPMIVATVVCVILLPILKVFSLLVALVVFISGVIFIKNKKSGKGWGWTTRFILSVIRKHSRRKVYVV